MSDDWHCQTCDRVVQIETCAKCDRDTLSEAVSALRQTWRSLPEATRANGERLFVEFVFTLTPAEQHVAVALIEALRAN